MRLTDYLAIYGAGLSTAVAVWNVSRARSKIRVLLTFAVDSSNGETRHGIGISIQNPSAHAAHVYTSPSNYGLADGLPVSIEPGKSHWIFVPDPVLEKLFKQAVSRRLKVQVQDALWRDKNSKVLDYPAPPVTVAQAATVP